MLKQTQIKGFKKNWPFISEIYLISLIIIDWFNKYPKAIIIKKIFKLVIVYCIT